MEVKRQSNVIVDALVSDEIGATRDQSVGYARTDEAAPEDFYSERSSVRPFNSVGGGNCSFSPNRTTPTYFVPNSVLWRQMNNQLTRDAVMGTIQYKPRPELDINIGGQFSRRKWVENRSDIVLAEGRRGITPTVNGVLADGPLLEWTANSRLESQTRIRQRDEDYYGGGFSAEWTDDAARIAIDISYSATQRDAEYRTDSIFAVHLDGEAYIADGFLRSTQQTSEPII
ncbi:hypothetical protein [Parasphingorhabdus halotolerans]|uniref:TonB-dependent receptor n=1 Tax=Parasphingorhabdus halotolerans TaxID=2725558 RepID=A0A6H2DK15_9SPHN|nr:hypothetical protein [Parasphingorhabdus halotolerans]QJB68538.1 hypothetical protein HF685_03900 [Parasphingorhabdus halotolerans]